MRYAQLLLYHVHAVASRNKWYTSCGTSGKLTLWTPLVSNAANITQNNYQLQYELQNRLWQHCFETTKQSLTYNKHSNGREIQRMPKECIHHFDRRHLFIEMTNQEIPMLLSHS